MTKKDWSQDARYQARQRTEILTKKQLARNAGELTPTYQPGELK